MKNSAEFFLPEDEMILTSRKLGANKILSSELFIKKKIKEKSIVCIIIAYAEGSSAAIVVQSRNPYRK